MGISLNLKKKNDIVKWRVIKARENQKRPMNSKQTGTNCWKEKVLTNKIKSHCYRKNCSMATEPAS